MKLHLLSDLHLEFAAFGPPATNADLLILAGDIAPGMRAIEFALACSAERPVLLVPGNHEYYHHRFPDLLEQMRAAARGTRVHLLDNETVEIAGARFLGATLWSDWELYGPEGSDSAMAVARTCMADYRLIANPATRGPLTPRDTLDLHRTSVAWLSERLAEPFAGPTVVVTHHAPSRRSSSARHANDELTPAFISNLDHLVERARLWVHGHTHHCVDYRIGTSRVISNQRGYPSEEVGDFDPELVVEV